MALILAALMLMSLCPAGAEDGDVWYLRLISAPRDAEYVDFGKVKVSDFEAFYAFLSQLPNVKKVDMFANALRVTQCEEIADRFPDIEFGWTIVIKDNTHTHTIRTDMTAYSTLHINGYNPHGNVLARAFRFCKHLKALDFGHNTVDTLDFLYELPELRVLIIACNQISDITPIASLKHLEYLEIFNNDITDISPLAGLTTLIDLNMGYNRVEDYTPLLGLKNLKRLWLYRSNSKKVDKPVPKDVVAMLKEALPDTHIDTVSEPSLGGWRDENHPHRQIVFRMMRTNVYEPFPDSWPENEE